VNVPNQLTVGRLLLTGFFVAALTVPAPFSQTLGLLLFAAAAFTDFLDGYLARKYGLITRFGKLMDPLADKVLMTAGFVMLVALQLIPGWVVIVILAREFLVTGLRLVAAGSGKVLAAETLGKHKTIWQIITLLYFLLSLASLEPAFQWVRPLFDHPVAEPSVLGRILIAVSLVLTVWSGVSYAIKNRAILQGE